VEKAAVRAVANFVDDVRLKVDVKRARNVLARRCFGEKGAKAVIVIHSVGCKTTIRLRGHVSYIYRSQPISLDVRTLSPCSTV
jgi:hypothetical protein